MSDSEKYCKGKMKRPPSRGVKKNTKIEELAGEVLRGV